MSRQVRDIVRDGLLDDSEGLQHVDRMRVVEFLDLAPVSAIYSIDFCLKAYSACRLPRDAWNKSSHPNNNDVLFLLTNNITRRKSSLYKFRVSYNKFSLSESGIRVGDDRKPFREHILGVVLRLQTL